MKYAPALLGVGQLSGSGGSVTASHNRYGTYLRNRVVPVNPNTLAQAGVRAVFGGLSQRWRTLTQSQRDAWSNLAPQVPRVDSLGQQYVLSGNALYVSVNGLADAVGDATNDNAPALDSPPVITGMTFSPSIAGIGGMALTYTATGGTANNNFIIRASAPRSPGKDYVSRGELKQIQVVAGNVASPIDIEAAYETVFGSGWESMLGMEIVVQMVPVSENHLPGVASHVQSAIVA